MPNAPSTPGIYEWQANTNTWASLTAHEVKADHSLGVALNPIYDILPPSAPAPPFGLVSTGHTTSTISLRWGVDTDATVAGVRFYVNGARYGSSLTGTSTAGTITGLAASTVYSIDVRRFNVYGESGPSNVVRVTTSAPSVSAPTAPTTFTRTALTPTTAAFSWTETTDATVTGHRLYLDGIKRGADLTAAATSATATSLAPASSHSAYVTRFNAGGESPPSPVVSFQTPSDVIVPKPLIGCSNVSSDHGGIKQWDVFRSYDFGTTANPGGGVDDATALGAKIVALTDPSCSTTGGATSASQLDAALTRIFGRYPNIEIHWANGNEIDRSDHLDISQASAWIETTRLQRQVIDKHIALGRKVSMWIDGTVNNIKNNQAIWTALKPAAPYLHGFATSAYPPGSRSIPIKFPAYNTYIDLCVNQAIAWGMTKIAVWEWGEGVDTADKNHRPLYCAGFIDYWTKNNKGLDVVALIYWDGHVAGSTDFQFSADPAGTTPSTALAVHDWQNYV